MSSRMCLALAAALLLASAAAAQEKKRLPGDVMIEKHLAAEADRLSAKVLDGAKTLDEWKQRRPRLHREYLDMLGLWPLPAKTPLHAKVTGQREAHGVIVENLHFQSKPGLYVTANLYRPKVVNGKLPAVLYVCGHSGRGRDGNKSAFQDHGFWFANNGYVCLILDTLQLGEIASLHHGTYGIRGGKGPAPTRMWWHSAGYTPAGVECWNGVRGIDYLLTRPEVDADKIGVTGISGGGAATFWIAAADERVKVAVPVSGMSDLESYVKNKVINGHCDCMFLYNAYQWDWTTIAALVAPRPLLFANSDNDSIFPMDGNRRIIGKLRTLYDLYGQPNLVQEYVSKGGHAYRPDLRIAIFRFINKHLKGDAQTKVEDSAKYTELPGKLLRAFPEDSDIPKDQRNTRIDETFVPRAKVALPAEGTYAAWRTKLLGELRQKVFRPLTNASFAAKRTDTKIDGIHILHTDANIELVWAKFPGTDAANLKSLLLLGRDEIAVKDPPTWGKPYLTKEGTMLVLRGYGGVSGWTRKSPPNYVERAHALLGQTIDRGRVHDVIATVRWGRRDGETPAWRVVGKGQSGILAAYAALFEPSIKEVVVIDPPKSHREGPHFLGVLRVLDVPEALGLLAPTPLTIIGGSDAAFDRTAEIYRRAGAADKLKRK